jgi:sec-independent protein translocase protein TatA
MPEILMILVIALIIFGPRKLPELGKSLGQGLAHFRRASEDFKRQWEDEVDLERRRIESPAPASEQASEAGASSSSSADPIISEQPSAEQIGPAPAHAQQTETVARETGRDWV